MCSSFPSIPCILSSENFRWSRVAGSSWDENVYGGQGWVRLSLTAPVPGLQHSLPMLQWAGAEEAFGGGSPGSCAGASGQVRDRG